MVKRSKTFILKCIRWSKNHTGIYKKTYPDIWNPYYKLFTNFSMGELEDMSKEELNNLLKVAISCLDADSYIKHIENQVKLDSKEKFTKE